MPSPVNDRSLTAHQLAKLLLDGPDLPVRFAYKYPDHWRTEVAASASETNEGMVAWSEYHRMDEVVGEEDDSGESKIPETGVRRVVIVR